MKNSTVLLVSFFIFILFAFYASPVSAAEVGKYTPLTGIYGITQDPNTGGIAPDISTFFKNIFNLTVGVAGILAVIMLTWGGIQYMASDVVSGKEDGRERMKNAVLGLLLVLFSVAILYSINPKILNFDLNIKNIGELPQQSNSGTSSSTKQKACNPDIQSCLEKDQLPGKGYSLTYFSEFTVKNCYRRFSIKYSERSMCEYDVDSQQKQHLQSGEKLIITERCVANTYLPASTPANITLCNK